jgi:hypothetical protein
MPIPRSAHAPSAKASQQFPQQYSGQCPRQRPRQWRDAKTTSLFGVLLLFMLTSCGAPDATSARGGGAPESAAPLASPAMEAPPAGDLANSEQRLDQPPSPPNTPVPSQKPQLIRNGEITVQVKSVDDAIKAVNRILRAQQGDLMNFQDARPVESNSPSIVTMQLRVPQSKLDTTLAEVAQLGTVLDQSLSAEDVSTQLVDLNARLRNLRRSEEALLNILERSGSIGDILKVNQELSKVRETIEQLDAQYKNLRAQVSFSRVSVTLQSELAAQSPQQSFGAELQDAWNGSTRALYDFSVALSKLLIFLLVFSPFWGTLLFLILRSEKIRKARRAQQPAPVVVAPLVSSVNYPETPTNAPEHDEPPR